MILCIKHIDIEGPGTLGDFLREQRFDVKEVNFYKEESLPQSLSGIDAVLCLGGPMNVYEEDRYSFLSGEDVFLKKVIDTGIPLLGICLGAQLIAKASGAKVKRSPVKEVGFKEIFLTDKGADDPLFKGLHDELKVFQWHEDTFDIPDGAILLGTGKDCFHQAFRVGRSAYGIQFHVEITHVDIDMWARAYLNTNDPDSDRKREKMVSDYFDNELPFREQALKLYENFVGLIRAKVTV